MKIALCCIAKCENLYLSEWVNHHLNLGFDHIYIYDNNDIKGERCANVIGDNQKVTVLTKFLGKKQKGCEIQVRAYNDFYKTFGKKYDWVLFSDVDEFLVLNKHTNVNDYIGSITDKKTKCVKLNWKCYGDNEQLHYENKPVVERFTKECDNKEENRFYKSFYKTKISGFELINVHYSLYVSTIVDCDGNEMKYEKNVKTKTVNTNSAYFAHYVTKSADEYYQIKKKRRSPGVSDNRLTIGHYFKYNTRTKEKEDYLLSLFNESKNPNEIIQNVCDYPFGVSVCISAWKTSEYIEECLNSVANQTWFKNHDNYEILLGIDGCKETLEKVREIMHKYKNLKVMMMDKNVGTYVTCNTIMKEAKYEWLMRFDSDDVMPNDMIEKIFSHDLRNVELIRYQYHNFGIRQGNGGLANGSHFVKNKIFNYFGGYRDWKISADYDFVYRIYNNVKYLELCDVYYNRRTHNNSLMNTNTYKMGSPLRKELDNYVKTQTRKNLIIKCKTTKYNEIYNNIPKLVVSFTTWTKRQDSAAKMLEHFKKQTLKPDKIYCYLSSDEYKGENLPKSLQKFVNEKYLEIKWVKENTYCHKRYEIFKEHNSDYVFIIDDDILYDQNYLNDMYNAALKYPKNVICYTGCRYEYTNKRINEQVTENPSLKNSFLGGLCCFPPCTFPLNDYFGNIDIRNKFAKKCDSSYVHVLLLKNNIEVFEINDRKNKWFTTINGTQDVGVWQENKKIENNEISHMENIVRNLVKAFNISDKFSKIYPKFK